MLRGAGRDRTPQETTALLALADSPGHGGYDLYRVPSRQSVDSAESALDRGCAHSQPFWAPHGATCPTPQT